MNYIHAALYELADSIGKGSLSRMLAWVDVKQRYRRSIIGPFWITISTGILVSTIGIVFGNIFNTPMDSYLPFLTIGIVLWNYTSTFLTEGCTIFINSEPIIKQIRLPLFVYLQRLLARSFIIFAHNAVVIPIVILYFSVPVSIDTLMVIPGFFLVTLCLACISLQLAFLCTRYRDIEQIVSSILQILYFLTPIMWFPAALANSKVGEILNINPFFHMIEIVRSPLLNQWPSSESWIYVSVLCIFLIFITLIVYGKYKEKVVYWL